MFLKLSTGQIKTRLTVAGSAYFYLFIKYFSPVSVVLEWKIPNSVIKAKSEKDFGHK